MAVAAADAADGAVAVAPSSSIAVVVGSSSTGASYGNLVGHRGCSFAGVDDG